MTVKPAGRRVAYDKIWGSLLALTCIMPQQADGSTFLWHLLEASPNRLVTAWLLTGTTAGIVGMVVGFAGFRGRWRHFLNFVLGIVTLALPLFESAIWERFPEANPANLPLAAPGAAGWVMLLGVLAVYAGSGIRVTRPSQIAGQALGGLGAFLLAVFAFLPRADGGSVAHDHLLMLDDFGASWRSLVPAGLIAAAVVLGTLNLLRSRLEVALAKLTRGLLVIALLFWVALPFLERGARPDIHLPVAWGALRFLGPFFLSLDGCIAFTAISITRSAD